MIHVNGGVVNPTFIEVAHWVKARPSEGDNYSVFIYSEEYLVPTESALLVRFTSGKVNVYGGTNADIISDWLGIVPPTVPPTDNKGKVEGPAPVEEVLVPTFILEE